tara:strand:- start:127 stop:1185 length:1059 start_codon:yes stop_codon:yes gene_type:complete
MKKLLVLLLVILASCAAPKKCCGQIQDLFKFSTFYGAVNGNTSISDLDVYSVTDGLETVTIETPFDYSVLFGVRKIKRFGYEPKEAFKNGTENSFSDAATIGLWQNKLEFLFQAEYKRQEGLNYFDQRHMIRYVDEKWLAKLEYVEDGFADVKFFESSQRYRKELKNGVSVNIGLSQRISEPYGYDPLEEWLLSNGNLHYTFLALEEGYTTQFDGQGGVEYFNPSGNSVATSTEVWEAVVIPEMLANYTEKKRDQLPVQWTYSWVAGFDYYKYSKTSWLHAWGNVMPLHFSDEDNEFSYYNFNKGQWLDYSGGIIYGHWFNKNLGLFLEGTYNKYWNRTWHGFSAGINYRVF